MLRRPFLLLSALAALAALGLGSATALAATADMTADSDPLVVLSGRVDVAKDAHVAEVVVFHGPVSVEGMVHGDVVALDGSVSVSGIVTGSVVALNGPVRIDAGAHVAGDVVSKDPPVLSGDARVDGNVRAITPVKVSLRVMGFVAWWIPVTFSTLALGLLMLWWFPRAVEAGAAATRSDIAQVLGWGLLVLVGLPLLSVLALVTIVGFPFGLGLILALGLLYSVGYVLGMSAVGGVIVSGRPVLGFVAGWAVLRVLALVPYMSGVFTWAAVVLGFGGAVVALKRSRSAVQRIPQRPESPAAM